MATESPFADKIERVKALIKAYMQEAPNLLSVYMFEQMGQDIGNEVKPPRNTTNQLRIQSTRLSRSFTPNESGNVTIVKQENGMISIQYGINLGEVPYARIHEFGGSTGRGGATKIPARPYLRPGFAAFIDKEVPRFYKRLAKELQS